MPEGVGGTASPEEITTAASRGDRHTLSPRCKQTRGCAHCSITACYQGEPMLILARMGSHPAYGGGDVPVHREWKTYRSLGAACRSEWLAGLRAPDPQSVRDGGSARL